MTPQIGDRAGPGRFVTFEGGEGAGKTTQIRRLANRLKHAGVSVVVTREPGGTPAAEAIRNMLLSGTAQSLGPAAEAVLFAAARTDHVDKLIRPKLAEGDWVLCDRFADSTRAYQGAAGIDPVMLEALERAAVGPTAPDLTIILDIPVEEGMARATTRSDPDRFERDALRDHLRRREIFLEIAMNEPGRCRVIDATADIEHVADAIWDVVSSRFALGEVTQNG